MIYIMWALSILATLQYGVNAEQISYTAIQQPSSQTKVGKPLHLRAESDKTHFDQEEEAHEQSSVSVDMRAIHRKRLLADIITCQDNSDYRSPLNNFLMCEDHSNTDCNQWLQLGLEEKALEELLENCPLSCGLCVDPSAAPTSVPSKNPTAAPSDSNVPSSQPSLQPSVSFKPSLRPTGKPVTDIPSNMPSFRPSRTPTISPSTSPSASPSASPTTSFPSSSPSELMSDAPSQGPTNTITLIPTTYPTDIPTLAPTNEPSHSPTLHPTSNPTITATTSSPTPICHDNAAYRSSFNDLTCAAHKNIDCHLWSTFGLNEQQIFELISNCPESCNIECDTYSMAPSHVPSFAPSSFPTLSLIKRTANVNIYAAPVSGLMDDEVVKTFESVALDYFVLAVEEAGFGSKLSLTGMSVTRQQIVDASRRRMLRQARLEGESNVLKILIEISASSRGLDSDAISELVSMSIESQSFAQTIQSIDFFHTATLTSSPVEDFLLPPQSDPSGKKSNAGKVAGTLISLSLVGFAVAGFLMHRRNKTTESFIPSPRKELTEISSSTHKRINPFSFQASPERKRVRSPIAAFQGVLQANRSPSNVSDSTSSHMSRSSYSHSDQTEDFPHSNRGQSSLVKLPPMILFDNIELSEKWKESGVTSLVTENIEQLGSLSDENDEQPRFYPVKRVNASLDLVEKFTACRNNHQPFTLADMLYSIKSHDDDEDEISARSPRSPGNRRKILSSPSSCGSLPLTPSNGRELTRDFEVAIRRCNSAGDVSEIEERNELDQMIRSQWEELGLKPGNHNSKSSEKMKNTPGKKLINLSKRVKFHIGNQIGNLRTPSFKKRPKKTIPENTSSKSFDTAREQIDQEYFETGEAFSHQSFEILSLGEGSIPTPKTPADDNLHEGRLGADGRLDISTLITSPAGKNAAISPMALQSPPLDFSPKKWNFDMVGASPPDAGDDCCSLADASSLSNYSTISGSPNLDASSAASTRVDVMIASNVGLRSSPGTPPHADVVNSEVPWSKHMRNGSESSFSVPHKRTSSDDSGFGSSFIYSFQAPSKGKLGLVIESSKNLGPTIHTVKDYSPLFGMVEAGDKIIRVDGIDTRRMTTGQVTRFLAQIRSESESGLIKITVATIQEKRGFSCDGGQSYNDDLLIDDQRSEANSSDRQSVGEPGRQYFPTEKEVNVEAPKYDSSFHRHIFSVLASTVDRRQETVEEQEDDDSGDVHLLGLAEESESEL